MKKLLALAIFLSFVSCAKGDVSIINTFNAGELSPHMDARVDFQKYNSGLRTLENFICLPYGGAEKRSGTQYIAETKNDGVARLAPFSVGVDQTYVMEMGHEYIRFYQDGIQIQTSSVPIEVVTPYSSNDVFEVQLAQFADTLYMSHPDYPPQKLQRTTTTPTFTMEEVTWDWPPVLDENLTDITISASAITGSVTLTASDDLFTADHVGSEWVIKTPHDDNKITLDIGNATTTTSDVLRVEGDWNLRTTGKGFEGTLKIQVSLDDQATWGDFREYENGDAEHLNYDRDGTEEDAGVYYRLVFEGDATRAGSTALLKNETPYLSGTVSVTNFLSATSVEATVTSVLGNTDATKLWSEAAFSAEKGYPRTVEFFENRLFFGGTEYQVNTIWASKTDSYENFQTGEFADSGMRISINSDNIIEWMLGRNQLFVGTLGDEWILSGGDSKTAITPTTILARRQTGFGSKDGMDALIASDSIMYMQRQGRKLREFEYSFEADAYKSADSTMLAEHITESGVKQIAEQQQPEPIIWCVREDGTLIGMTYSKVQNVNGWHRHTTDGTFESIAIIPTTGEDRIYVIVNRDNGRYVEWFRPVDWGDDDEDAWFVDSGLDYDGGASVDIDDITLGTNVWSILGQTKVPTDYTWSGSRYEVFYSGETYYFSFGGIPDVNQLWSIKHTHPFGVDPLYSDLSLSTNMPPHTNWYYTAFSQSVATDGKFYQRGADVTASNSLSDGDYVQLSGEGGFLWRSFGEGIFQATNCTSTNFTLLYTDETDPYAYGTYTGGVSFTEVKNTFTNVAHLAGETLNIFADGGVVPDATVSTNGVLTTAEYYNHVTAGLPYTAKLSPMYLEVVNSSQISYGKVKNPYKVHFRVGNSGAWNYGTTLDSLTAISVRESTLPAGSPVPFFSGDRGQSWISTTPSTSPTFWVTSDEPLPLEILSLTIFTTVTEYE